MVAMAMAIYGRVWRWPSVPSLTASCHVIEAGRRAAAVMPGETISSGVLHVNALQLSTKIPAEALPKHIGAQRWIEPRRLVSTSWRATR
jgi:hypothetical protein